MCIYLKGYMAKFNIIKFFLPPQNNVFFDLFEDAIKICQEGADLLNDIVNSNLTVEHLSTAKKLKHSSNDLYKKTLILLNNTFVTPLEREDIQEIAILLNKITKRVVQVCFSFRVFRLKSFNENIKKQAQILVESVKELCETIKIFEKNTSAEQIMKSNLKIKEIETSADEVLYIALDDIFSGEYNSIEVMKLKDVYEELEDIIDDCLSVSDQIVNIVLKQS